LHAMHPDSFLLQKTGARCQRRRLGHFHFWCLQGNRAWRGFSSRKDALRYSSQCRVEVKML